MEVRCSDLENDPRKITLSNALRNILSPSEQTRRKAEELIKALEVIDNFGMYLVDCGINENEKIEIRLLSIVLLKQYVETHWCKHSDKYRKPEIPRLVKEYIKNSLSDIFVDSNINLRKNVSRVIAAIALFEYPDHWPDFFNNMIVLVKSGDDFKSHGAIQTLYEYIVNSSDIKLNFILDILGYLLEIITSTNQIYSIRTRSRAVRTFKVLVPDLKKFILKNDKCKDSLESYIRSYLHAFLQLLHSFDTSLAGCDLKNNIIQAIEKIILEFSYIVQPYLQQILPLIWETLVKASNEYKGQTSISQDYLNDDGDIVNNECQIITIFEFVRTVYVQSSEISYNIYNVLPDFMYHTIVCMQITPVIMADWNKNYENFISDENNDNVDYKVRHAAYILLNEIMNISDRKRAVSAFCQALCRHICHAETSRKANVNDWWQGLEASMYALGCVRYHIINEYNAAGLSDFNLMGYLNTAAQYTQENDIAMLLGRCIWLCGMFCRIMVNDMLQIVVESTVKHLQCSSSVFVRVYALRALNKFCEPYIINRTRVVLENHLSGILNCLCNIVNQVGVKILRLTLEVMSLFVKVNESFTAASVELIVPFAISIFFKYNDDPLITTLMMNLIRALVKIANLLPQLQEIFTPTLLSVLNSPVSCTTVGIHIVALETLGIIVRNQQGNINERFLQTLFPAAVHVILHSNDFHVLQAGGECMSNFLLSDAAQQVCMYRDSEGTLGIDFIIDIINKLLDPYGHEYNAKFIRLLIIVLIVKAGEHLFARLEPLLRAILSKMQCTESDCNMQNLISIFAYLIYTQLDAVINFLSTIPGPNGEAALEFVLIEWVYTHSSINTEFDYKIGIVALIQLFEYGITKENFVLRTMAINENESCSNVNSYRLVPILAKILKVLLNSFNTNKFQCMESGNQSQHTFPANEQNSFEYTDKYECSVNDEMDESIIALLPVLRHLDTNKHICSFFQMYKDNELFQSFFTYFDETECTTLRHMGIDISRLMLSH